MLVPANNQFDDLLMMDIHVVENQQLQQAEPVQDEGLRCVLSADSLLLHGRPSPLPLPQGEMCRRKSENDVEPLQKKRRKLLNQRVQIQVEPRLVVEPMPLALEEYNETCWHSKEDLKTARRLAKRLSRLLVNSGSDVVLMDAFGEAMCPRMEHLTKNDINPAMETTMADQEQHKAKVVNKLKQCSAFWKQRGLERLAQQHSISRSMQVCYVKSSVLLEQSSQHLDGKQDPERLAQVSRETSGPSLQFAQMLVWLSDMPPERL